MIKNIFLLFFLLPLTQFAQDFNPREDEIFKELEVTEIRLTMSQEDEEFLLANENKYSEEYVKANVTFNNSELVNETVTNVGVRLRGNTARDHPKRSFKIDFKQYGGERYESYKKINLKPNVNDPSVVRELLTMHIYRLMDVPAPRVAPAVLYLNNTYMGVYLMLEQIDDEFVDKRFGKEVGWLYKCGFGATLEDDGQVRNENLYESKMNEETDTRDELEHFVRTLNNSPGATFKSDISEIFAVDRYLRQLAVEAVTGHWDGYSYLNNNYYMYYDEDAGKFEFIAYDTDNTWGIDWVDRDWAQRDLTHFHRNGHPRPLTSRILGVQDWENRYYGYINTLFNNYFTEEYLHPFFDQLENILDEYVRNDERFDDSFGFSYQDFKNAFDFTSIKHAKYGLRDFLQTRRDTGIPSIPSIILGSQSQRKLTYPNPSSTGIFILKGHNLNSQIQVLNNTGKLIQWDSTRLSSSHLELKLPRISGVYFLRIGEEIIRLVVQ